MGFDGFSRIVLKEGRHNYLSGTLPFRGIAYVFVPPCFLPAGELKWAHCEGSSSPPSNSKIAICQLGHGPIAAHIMSRKRAADGCTVMAEDSKKLEMKFASLKEDYKELQRETRALKKRVKRAKQKKSNLWAEVRFLRQRYKLLKQEGSVVAYEGASQDCTMERRIKSPTEGTSTEEEHVTQEQIGLEYASPSDDSYTAEIIGSRTLAARNISVLSQKLLITPPVEHAKKKARFVCNGLVSALKPSEVKDGQINLIPTMMDRRRTISSENEVCALKPSEVKDGQINLIPSMMDRRRTISSENEVW